jgi:hypothetical protein
MKLLSVLIVLFLAIFVKSSNAKILCLDCKSLLYYDNVTSDIAEHMYNCQMQESYQCYGGFSISYTNEKQQIYPSFLGQPISPPVLEDLRDTLFEYLTMSFDKYDVSRSMIVECSDSSNCSVYHVKQFHKKSEFVFPVLDEFINKWFIVFTFSFYI